MGRFVFGVPPLPRLLPGDKAELTRPLLYLDDRGVLHSVPCGYVCDGASIPRAAWSVVGHPLQERYFPAAALHDWHYREQTITRARADRLFYDALRAYGVSRRRATSFYCAVRVGGWMAWRQRRRERSA